MVGGSLFPFEFYVAETPRSLGASADSRQRWQALLQQSARKRIAELVEFCWLDERPLALSVFYFPPASMEGDVDNIIKPIMDALAGVLYPDDKVVERVLAQKFEPDTLGGLDYPSYYRDLMAESGSVGTVVTRTGAVLIAVALVALGIGLIQAA
jgi:hypothetical protein